MLPKFYQFTLPRQGELKRRQKKGKYEKTHSNDKSGDGSWFGHWLWLYRPGDSTAPLPSSTGRWRTIRQHIRPFFKSTFGLRHSLTLKKSYL
jgi:hypothetical protein